MNPRPLPRGLYVITDAGLTPGENLPLAVAAAIRGGARTIQYRNKSPDPALRLREAAVLRSVCTQAGAVFIVNDDPVLARVVGADGVHVGRDDPDPHAIRADAGADLIVGVSCYADPEAARAAVAAGADYVAFGSVFPSATKPGAVSAPLALLGEGSSLGVPVVAIGGIAESNIGSVSAAGAHAAAVVSAVFADADPENAARRLSRGFFASAGAT